MMKAAKHENKKIVSKEKSAVGDAIKAMQKDIRRQTTGARKQAAKREEEAKKILAKATRLMVQAKAGKSMPKVKGKKKLENNTKVLKNMSWKQLKNNARKVMKSLTAKNKKKKKAHKAKNAAKGKG